MPGHPCASGPATAVRPTLLTAPTHSRAYHRENPHAYPRRQCGYTLSIPIRVDDHFVDPRVSCSSCAAVCCRLTVIVATDDTVPRHLVERNAQGVDVMARGVDGWCIAVDAAHARCTIYNQRPAICRKFTTGSAYCRDERARYERR